MTLKSKSSKSIRKTALVGAASLVGGLAIFALGTPAVAERGDHRGHHKAHLEAADTNGDGKVSKAEADAVKQKRFKETDLDGDGSVSFEEFEAMAEKRRQMKMKRRLKRPTRTATGH